MFYVLHIIFESDFNYLKEPDRDGFKILVENEINDLIYVFVNYLKTTFPKLYDVLELRKHETGYTKHSKIIYIVINIFISEFYKKTTKKHQEEIKLLMDA